MNYVTLVINSKDENSIVNPFLHEKTIEDEGFYLDFRQIFKGCAENILFGKTEIKRILNMDIEKVIIDYSISEQELYTLISLYKGECELTGSARTKLVDLMLTYWTKSENFRAKSSVVLEDIEMRIDLQNKHKILDNFENNLPIGNLREFFRFSLNENYTPIENIAINFYHKHFNRIYKTDIPLVYYIAEGDPIPVQVLYGTGLFVPVIKSKVEEGENACCI